MHREWKEERRNAQCIIEKSPNILATLQWQSSGLPDPALSIGLIVCVVKTWYHQSECCCVLLNRVLTQFLAVSAFQHSHCSHCIVTPGHVSKWCSMWVERPGRWETHLQNVVAMQQHLLSEPVWDGCHNGVRMEAKLGTSGPNFFLSLNRFARDGFSLSLCFQEAQVIWFVWLAWFGHKSDAGLRAIYLPVKTVWVVNVVKSLLTFLGLEQILPWQPAQHWRTSPQMSSY